MIGNKGVRMKQILHITSGDIAGDSLRKSGIAGEVFVWHDILYDGPKNPGWPDEAALHARAQFLEDATGGGLTGNLRGQIFILDKSSPSLIPSPHGGTSGVKSLFLTKALLP